MGAAPANCQDLFALRAPAALQVDVLHLDITPLNVLLARDRTAKILYGSFARLEATTEGRTRTCPFPWASPEMLLATGRSKASDVYSFGEHFPGCSGKAVAYLPVHVFAAFESLTYLHLHAGVLLWSLASAEGPQRPIRLLRSAQTTATWLKDPNKTVLI